MNLLSYSGGRFFVPRTAPKIFRYAHRHVEETPQQASSPAACGEGTIAQVSELGKLYGDVDVPVLDYTIGGRKVIVPQDATPFTISGDTYRNPWLGLTVQKPQTFRFTQLDGFDRTPRAEPAAAIFVAGRAQAADVAALCTKCHAYGDLLGGL